MLQNRYQWGLELMDPAGGNAERIPLGERIAWEPAEECVRWAAVRSGESSPDEAWAATATVEPIGSATFGEPYAAGFRISLAAAGKEVLAREFPILYFKGLAQECAAPWVQSGRLAGGERFRYLITAFRQDERAPDAPPTRASIRTLAPAIVIDERVPDPAEAQPSVHGGSVDDADLRLVVPRSVLNETAEHALRNPATECGGFLLGRFHRHTESRDVVTTVTGYMPVRAEGTATRLNFTPECWTAARSAMALRANGEALIGWVHSHIVDVLCAGCGEEKRRDCPLASGFFSEHDRSVQRIAFPRAYQVAVVVNLSGGNVTHSCFGWKDGVVAARGFHVNEAREEQSCPEHE